MRPILLPEIIIGTKGLNRTRAAAISCSIEADNFGQSVTDRSIADLVVILNESYKPVMREISGLAAMHSSSELRISSVIDKVALKGFGQLLQLPEVGVISLRRAGVEDGKQCVMKIVAPLGIHAQTADLARSYDPGVVEITFSNQHQTAAKGSTESLDLAGQLLKKVNRGRVDNA
jgi:hypothetical protein